MHRPSIQVSDSFDGALQKLRDFRQYAARATDADKIWADAAALFDEVEEWSNHAPRDAGNLHSLMICVVKEAQSVAHLIRARAELNEQVRNALVRMAEKGLRSCQRVTDLSLDGGCSMPDGGG